MYLVLKKTRLKKSVGMPDRGIIDPVFDANRRMWGKTWASFGTKDNSQIIKNFLVAHPEAAQKIWNIVGRRMLLPTTAEGNPTPGILETLSGEHWHTIFGLRAGHRTPVGLDTGAHNVARDLLDNISGALAHWKASDIKSGSDGALDWEAAEKLADYQLAAQPTRVKQVGTQSFEYITHLFPIRHPNGAHEYLFDPIYWGPKSHAATQVHRDVVGRTFQHGNLRPDEAATPPKVNRDPSEDVVAFPNQESFDKFNWHMMHKINSLAVNLSAAGVSDRELGKTLKTHADEEAVSYLRTHWGKSLGGRRGNVVSLTKDHYGWNSAARLAHEASKETNPTFEYEAAE